MQLDPFTHIQMQEQETRRLMRQNALERAVRESKSGASTST